MINTKQEPITPVEGPPLRGAPRQRDTGGAAGVSAGPTDEGLGLLAKGTDSGEALKEVKPKQHKP